MARTKISEFSATPGNNTDIDGINIAEGCAPSGINDAIRELMSQLKDFQAGTAGDSFNGPVGTTTAAAGAFTTLSASSTVSGTGFSNYLASPPAIGGTTAAAGSFTTLSASSTVTFSGGTANGVLYLNGSKVATSGSALTFDGQTLTNTRDTPILNLNDTAAGNVALRLLSTGGMTYIQSGISGGAFASIAFTANGGSSEQMRLTSTGLGVGTSSPAVKLDVNGSVNISSGQNLTWGGAYAANIPTMYAVSGANGYFYWSPRGNTGSYMTLDANSNLGLGVAPSAWASGAKALQIKSYGALYESVAGKTTLTFNSYESATNTYKYLQTEAASMYQQVSGGHYWFTAPSGTAGNAISFTQAMTLDASGNLMVKTTTARANITTDCDLVTQNGLVVLATSSTYGQAYQYVRFLNSAAAYTGSISQTASTGIGLYSASDLIFGANSGEKARITSGGFSKFSNDGTYFNAASYHEMRTNAANYIAYFSNTNASDPYGPWIRYTAATPNNTINGFLNCEDSSAVRLTIRSNGGIANYQANDVNLSDRREKKDFAPAKSYLETICAIPVQTFKYIDQTDDEKTLGVVAQDVQAVAPELVSESNWGTEDNPKVRLSIYQTDLQYALMKCIQELKAEVDSLKAQLKGA